MTDAERVLAEVAKRVHLATDAINFAELRDMTAPYLPKPDRLTVAAEDCLYVADSWTGTKRDHVDKIRAIIAREVAAAERGVAHFVFGEVK